MVQMDEEKPAGWLQNSPHGVYWVSQKVTSDNRIDDNQYLRSEKEFGIHSVPLILKKKNQTKLNLTSKFTVCNFTINIQCKINCSTEMRKYLTFFY